MAIQEIPAKSLDAKKFIDEQAALISQAVGPTWPSTRCPGEWILRL